MSGKIVLAAIVALLILGLNALPAPGAQKTFTLEMPGCTA